MQNLTDTELLDAYVAGANMPQGDTCGKTPGEAAFGELMRRHGALVYRACHRLLKDPHEAEDASQAVFVVLARKAGKLRKGDLSAWLYRVAHHVAAETVRRRMRRTGREDTYAATEAIQVGEFAINDAAESDMLGLLDTALLSLPERYRQAVILRYLQNHSEKDAAQRASVPLGTLSGRASQGIAMLRKRLGKLGMATSATALVSLLTSEASAAVPETLLPSILAVVKTAVATGAAATTATTTAAMLAKGAMKAMFWNSVKTAAMVAVSVGVLGVGGVAAVQATHETAPSTTTGKAPEAVIHLPVASSLRIGNLRVTAHDSTKAVISFDVAWSNSWRSESKFDAAWVFFKMQLGENKDVWQPIRLFADKTLNPTGYGQSGGTPLEFVVPNGDDGFIGMFVQRAENGTGTVTAQTVTVLWDIESKLTVKEALNVPIRAFGIEMVHVAEGEYYLGKGPQTYVKFKPGYEAGQEPNWFYRHNGDSNASLPYLVTGSGPIPTGRQEGRLWAAGLAPEDNGQIPASFPNGYAPFYCMKFAGVAQGLYADFLNTLPGTYAEARCSALSRSQAIKSTVLPAARVYSASAPDELCPGLSWTDNASFAAWAGLRPMTELEYEKAVRGPRLPAPNDARSSYWGLEMVHRMLLSEQPVTVGNATGRKFRGSHGGGTIDIPPDWPKDVEGAVLRGGGYFSYTNLMTAGRVLATPLHPLGSSRGFAGWRAARSAPSAPRMAETPVFRIPFLRERPTIDGVMNPGEWDDASALSAFFDSGRLGAFTNLAVHQIQPQVYAGYDKTNLYFCFTTPIYPEGQLKAECTYPDTLSHSKYGILSDDHMEIELRPIDDLSIGYQRGLFRLDVNPIGTVSDWYWSMSAGQDLRWNSGATIRSLANGKRWVVEYAIPLKSLRYGKYDANDAEGRPLVAIPPPDGTAYRVWFACKIGDNFSAFDGHAWDTTKTKLILDSQSPAFQLNDLGPITDGQVDVQMTVKNHSTRPETVRIGFQVESVTGTVYSSYQSAEIPNGLVELRPGELRKLRIRQDNLPLTPDNNVLWFDVRSLGTPEKTLFRTRLTKFQQTDGGGALAQLRQAEEIGAYRDRLKKYPGTQEAALAHSALEKMGSRSPDATHVALVGKAAEIEKKAQETKVTLSIKEMTADNALDMLSMRSGITIRKTDIPKDAKFSMEMRDASVLDGVLRVTKMLGLTYVIVDDAIEVSGKKKE